MNYPSGRRDGPFEPSIDLAAALRMIREVGREIALERLTERVLALALEHCRAERGLLILLQGGAWRVAAEGSAADAVAVRGGDDLASPGRRCDAVLDAIARTREHVLLHDGAARSILGLPLIADEELLGALYLEDSAARAFAPGRVETLRLLAAQASSALRLARVVAGLKQAFRSQDTISREDRALRTMLEVVPQQIFVLRNDLGMEFANRAILDYHGEHLTEALFDTDVERRDRALHHPEDLPHLNEQGYRTLAHGLPLEVEGRLLRKDGEYRWFLIRINPLHDEQGRVVRWYGTRTDIDDRKKSEERVRQDERELRMVVDLVPELLVALDPEGRVLHANRAALDYTGRTLEEVTAVDDVWPLIIHPDELALTRTTIAGFASGSPSEVEVRLRRADGEYRWFLGRNTPLRDEEGCIVRWFATGTDIDDRKRAEQRVRDENLALREEVDKASMFEEIVGSARALRAVLRSVAQVAPTDSTVLILGETGTGKELVARAIHKRSRRAARAFVGVNCAAIPPTLIASELFGHEKGAFTGALQRRPGRFELADGGTIFLDEIGDLPLDTQLALLRVLQEREFERVGSTSPRKVDVRVIAATNRDLGSAMDRGTFRTDLFYRLNVFPIEIPPLRARAADIPLLVTYFVERYASRAGKTIRRVERSTLELMQSYGWPGNVRELQNVIERAVILCESDELAVDRSWLAPGAAPAPGRSLVDQIGARERELIEQALAESGGRVSGPSGAAARLGLPASTLESKIRSFGIDKHRFKAR